MRVLLRITGGVALLLIVLLLAAPALLYRRGLNAIDGRPARPQVAASEQERDRIWRQAGGSGARTIDPTNPYRLTLDLLSGHGKPPAGEAIAFWISRAYAVKHCDRARVPHHLCTAALTIWLTRHWTTDDLLTLGAQTVSADPRAPLVTPARQQ